MLRPPGLDYNEAHPTQIGPGGPRSGPAALSHHGSLPGRPPHRRSSTPTCHQHPRRAAERLSALFRRLGRTIAGRWFPMQPSACTGKGRSPAPPKLNLPVCSSRQQRRGGTGESGVGFRPASPAGDKAGAQQILPFGCLF